MTTTFQLSQRDRKRIITENCSRAQELLVLLKCVRQDFELSFTLASTLENEEQPTLEERVSEVRRRIFSYHDGRHIGDIMEERRSNLRKLAMVFDKYKGEHMPIGLGEKSCSSTEATDTSNLSSSSWESHNSMNNKVRLIIEDPGQLAIVHEEDENVQKLEKSSAVVLEDALFTPINSNSSRPFTAEGTRGDKDTYTLKAPIKTKSLSHDLIVKNKFDLFWRSSLAPFCRRLSDGSINMTYSYSTCGEDEDESLHGTQYIMEGRSSRLRELYSKDVEKMRRQKFTIAKPIRSRRQIRNQLAREILPTTRVLGHHKAKGIAHVPSYSNRRQSHKVQVEELQGTEILDKGCINGPVGRKAKVALNETNVEDLCLQIGGMMRTVSFCEGD